jgi:hypothetical protein
VLEFLPSKPVAAPLRDAWAGVDPDVVKVASAFASEAGVEVLRDAIGSPPFGAAKKQWLIGIQEGITHPKALERLRKIRHSEVRVPFGSDALAAVDLRAPRFFHPKLFYFENSLSGNVAIVSTSANLTHSALRGNIEQVLMWRGVHSDEPAETLREWWAALWGAADVATAAFVAEYESKRPKLPVRKKALIGQPADSVLQKATAFWVELTRKPEGGSFNQIELLYNGRFFFFPGTKKPSQAVGHPLTFEDRLGNVYGKGCQITFNGPPRREGGNHMWRVYMPTFAQGLRGYQDGDVLVRFERTSQANHYRVAIALADSPLALRWIEISNFIKHPGPPPRRMGWA